MKRFVFTFTVDVDTDDAVEEVRKEFEEFKTDIMNNPSQYVEDGIKLVDTKMEELPR